MLITVPCIYKCGTISWNQNGVVLIMVRACIWMTMWLFLILQNVTIENNYYSIPHGLWQIPVSFKGQNSLKPIQTGIGHSVFGLLMALHIRSMLIIIGGEPKGFHPQSII